MPDNAITSEGVPEKQPVSIGSKVKEKMPAGKGRYTIGAKGTHGCKGFPVVGGEGKVHGCHTTRSAAMRQQAAIYASQNQKKLADTILDLAKAQEMLENFTMERMDKANSISTGDMVSWGSSGGTARGKVVRVIRNGKYNVPSSDFTITGTPDDPAVAIRVYRDGKPTDTIVGHKMSTLRGVGKSMHENNMDDEENDWMKRDYTPEQRRAMARRGQAMPDGSFPIGNRADLENAIQSVGRAANYDAARRHIISRARSLGAIDMLPEEWNVSKSLNGLFKNMPSVAKRVNTTGNAKIDMNLFKDN